MFFFSKKPSSPDYSVLQVDMHSHLLPGIDDGSPDLEISIELIRSMQELGFTKLITTPHIMGDMYPNTPEIISDRLSVVKQELNVQGIQTELDAAAEYFLDETMERRVKNSEPLLALPGNRVLCEFSMLTPTMGVKELIFEMQMQGSQVVIAHPERYGYLQSNKGFYEELKDMGCWFQLNLLSLTSHYGKTVSDLASFLIRNGYYDLVGTDLHNQRHVELLRNPKIGEGLKRVMDQCRIRNNEFVEIRE
ncbi:MAG: histidinol phosphatase [Cryomorphaceae bacterium]|nr:histidinol phosphatase [Cryomorphaceae bacterium]